MGFFKYELNDEQYGKVRTQLIQKKQIIGFINEDGEPICVSLRYPALYGTIQKHIKPKHVILPDGKGPGIIKN